MEPTFGKVVWKSVLMAIGVLSVMMAGISWMPMSFADSLASFHMVSYSVLS